MRTVTKTIKVREAMDRQTALVLLDKIADLVLEVEHYGDGRTRLVCNAVHRKLIDERQRVLKLMDRALGPMAPGAKQHSSEECSPK